MSNVILLCLCSWNLVGVFGIDSVTEGDSVSLSVSLTEEQRGNTIIWRFGPTKVGIAEMNVKENTTKSFDKERADGRFRDRLKLDVQSVSLIITHIRITDSGLYYITISGQEKPLNRFNIIVARLPVPIITRHSSSSVSNCSVLCSVMNVAHDVSVSWYKGNRLLSSISVSDLNIRLSLHLECLDDSYSCVINNSISMQTQHLNTDVCLKCSVPDPSSESFCCFGFTEAVIRLVVSALVGVATVAVLVYDIRARRNEQKKKRSDVQMNDQ